MQSQCEERLSCAVLVGGNAQGYVWPVLFELLSLSPLSFGVWN